MSNTCPECGTALRELLFSRYCPNEENHGTFKGIDRSVDNNRYGALLHSTPVVKPTFVPAPTVGGGRTGSSQTYHRRFKIAKHDFVLNAQTAMYYTWEIVLVPSVRMIGFTLTPPPGVSAYASGQHITNAGKAIEVTIVVETTNPTDMFVEFQAYLA